MSLSLLSTLALASCHPATRHEAKRIAASAAPEPAPFTTVLPAAFAEPPGGADPALSFCAGATTAAAASTEPLAAYAQATGLSPQFTDQCAGCHGYTGEGRDAFPALPGALDAAAFAQVVRAGRHNMPAFTAAIVGDEVLAADAAALTKLRAHPAAYELPSGFHDATLPTPLPIAAGDYADAMNAGLVAWRNPGGGGSCAGCHGPDGLDLARIGYGGASILRRALAQGRTPAEATAIAAMIRAQRRRFHVVAPCSPTFFRPLQPGGKLAADDSALESGLKERGVDLSVVPADAAAAQKLAAALAALDPRLLPVAIPFTYWTADSFNGPALRSAAEWIPELPVEPAAPAWIEAQNAYLAAPTPTNFWRLDDLVAGQDAPNVGARLAREKYRAVLLLQDMARYDARVLPDLAAAADTNRFPVWEAAQVSSVLIRGCAEDGNNAGTPFPCWGYTPKFFEKMGTDRDFLTADAESLVLPWLTAGLLLDPALRFTENGKGQMMHWHQAFVAAHGDDLPLHRVYFAALQLAKATSGCWSSDANGPAQWKSAHLSAITEPRAKAAAATVEKMLELLVAAKTGC